MSRGRRLLALVPDAFGDPLGSLGGIALYNRDLLTAACAHPEVEEVVALPRLMPAAPGALPERLRHVTRGLGGRARYLAAVAAEAARGRYDLILCGHLNLLPAAFVARLLTRAPVAVFVYGIEAWQPTPYRLANRLLRRVRAVVTIRPLTLERLLRWSGAHPPQTFLLETAVHVEALGPGPRDPALVERYGLRGRRVLLTTARLDERRKGIDEVMEVLPALLPEAPDLAYLVVGGGPDRARLEQRARALGVQDRVVFAGPVPEAEKAAHLRLADVFVMAGTGFDFDRYPLRYSFLEAMACGLPIVAARPEDESECARPPSSENVLVDPFDPGSLGQGIRAALARPRGSGREAEAFSYPRFRERVHAILDALATGASVPGLAPFAR